ncbi:MAG: SCP2 sterol-binding domain-containing protein [Ferrimicrobium sp.]|jgi:putative sterol carrier protein|uniref:SCP2 sterol-binding domain-containing protein n=1 Tax=Ferrimicrobium acidiphilum TaxID=121039 RepID=A0ABV3Y1V6_9ACTN|nr:SCP2 sterol-binding domain-containing protein [Ferrimicrobium sp.]
MATWLSPEWIADTLELGAAMPYQAGVSATLQYYLTSADGGEYAYYWSIQDGQLGDAAIGEHPHPDVELSMSLEDARGMQTGLMDATSAFMEGRLRVDGNLDLLMQLLPITGSKEYQELERELARRTDFDHLGS